MYHKNIFSFFTLLFAGSLCAMDGVPKLSLKALALRRASQDRSGVDSDNPLSLSSPRDCCLLSDSDSPLSSSSPRVSLFEVQALQNVLETKGIDGLLSHLADKENVNLTVRELKEQLLDKANDFLNEKANEAQKKINSRYTGTGLQPGSPKAKEKRRKALRNGRRR